MAQMISVAWNVDARLHDRRHQTPAAQELLEVAQRECPPWPRGDLDGPAADVWQQHHVVERQQRLWHVGLVGEDVQTHPGERRPAVSASTNASSSTTLPRAMLTRKPSAPRASMTAPSTSFRGVASPRRGDDEDVDTAGQLHRRFDIAIRRPLDLAPVVVGEMVQPNACAEPLGNCAFRSGPGPMIPTRVLLTCRVAGSCRRLAGCPARRYRSAAENRRITSIVSPTAVSANAIGQHVGVLLTPILASARRRHRRRWYRSRRRSSPPRRAAAVPP